MKWLSVLAVALLAGCTQGPGSTETTPPIETITNPLQNRTAPGSTPHLHDYWGGQHTLTLADADIVANGFVWFDDSSGSVATLRPESGDVVPQGTGWVNVTVSWTEKANAVPPNAYGNPQLYVRSAADSVIVLRANLTTNPATVSLPVNATQADLPHQVLSAWQFDFFVAAVPPPATNPAGGEHAAFSGTVHFLVTADHTRPIPVFPGHPAQWNGRSRIDLFKGGGHLFFNGDPTTKNWSCYDVNGCPVVYHPDSSVIVPTDGTEVTVKLGLTNPGMKLGIKFHGADAREFAKATVGEDSDTMRIYHIQVAQGGDGSYTRQSQWEIVPFVEGPVEDGFTYQDYTIEAFALK